MKKFKTIIFLIVLILLALISIGHAGIDEMRTRQPGQPPVEQNDNPGNGNGNGGGNGGGNPNVPIDDYLPVLIIITACYGVYKIKNSYVIQDKIPSNKFN